ncbi:MAG TPA: PA14 domain-containing protein [Chloroflexia bacterium]|nr:PA14 domain-containing protein [Chloroflexia bacterium]
MSQQQPAGRPNAQGRGGAAGVPVRRKRADDSLADPTIPPTSTPPPQPPDDGSDAAAMLTARPDGQTEPAAAPARGWTYRRERLRWAFGLASLGVALLAQKVALDARAPAVDSPPLLSWVLYAAAIALFALAVPRAPYLAPPLTTPFLSTLRAMRRRRRRLFLGLLVGAGVLGLASVPLFVLLNLVGRADWVPGDPGWFVSYGPWLLYVGALLLLAAAWVVWERSAPARRDAKPWQIPGGRLPRGTEWAVMGGLLLLAMLFRLPLLDSAPPGMWFDEAMNGVVARDLMLPDTANATYIGDATQMGALYFYFLGRVIELFGQADVWPLRLLPALAGSAIAPLLYVIGSRLFGWRVGLAAGVFVAVSVWNITMSRLGLVSIPTVALNVGVYACLVQGLRTGRLGYYAGGGVLLGLALQMYYASQLVPVVLVLVFAHLLITGRMAAFRAVRAGAVAFVLAAVLAGLPILTFAAQFPQAYTERAGTVSIFTPEGSDNKPDALATSIKSHALMFTYRGDRNPRHNMTEAQPMLEWPVSALFVVGLGACVLRLRRWHYFFPVVWLLVAASGGVLSAVFEAPQGHRTMENSVVTALLAGIVAGELWAVIAQWAVGMRRKREHHPSPLTRHASRGTIWVGAIVVAALLVWAGAANYDRYFNRQVVSAAVWNEMQGPNREVADVLLRYGATHRVLVTPARNDTPATRYLTPQFKGESWEGPRLLPFHDVRDTVIMVDRTEEADVSVVKAVYPDAQVQTITYGDSRQVQVYTIFITAAQIDAVRGVRHAVYTDGEVEEGTRANLSLEGISGAPPGSMFEMSSTLKITAPGDYTFDWTPPLDPAPAGAEPVTVLVDGAPATRGQELPLAAGLHNVTVRGAVESAATGGELVWQGEQTPLGAIPETVLYDPRKVAPMGLTAYVRQGTGFEGSPVTMRIDPIVSFYFTTTPIPRPYTVEWVGKLYAPVAGPYILFTEQISKSRLFVDGREVLYNDADNTLDAGHIELTVGLHDIRIEYQDLADYSHMYLYWTPPGRDGRYTIPAPFLLPEMAEYPAVPSTGRWPAPEEADDTVWDLNPASQQPGAEAQPTPPPAGEKPAPTPTAAQGATAPTAPAAAASPVVPSVLLGGPDDQTLKRPLAGAADEDGNLYVFVEAGKVYRFGPSGEPLGSWDVRGAEGKPLTEVSAMVVREGRVSLLDSGSSSLITYSLDGEEQGRTQLCQCFYPRGMSVALDGSLWVADTGLGRVIKVTPEGTLVSTLGEQGTGPGQFAEPAGVWQAADGTVYVADVGNQRVQSFDANGNLIAQWPIGKSTARDGSRVVATPDGNVLVTEQQVQAVVLYDRQGNELARWAFDPGTGTQAPSIIVPAGEPGRYLLLFPFNATSVVFTPTP